MRKPIVLVLAAASLGAIALAGPASAACVAGDTSCATTLVAVPVINAGTLAIAAAPVTVGTSLSLGTTTTSSAGLPVISGALTLTTVTDTRLSSTGWSVTATADAFSATIGTATATIPGSAASFTVPTAVATLGSPTLTPATSSVGNGGAIITAGPPTGSTTLGPNTVQFTPSIKVSIPAGTALATYTGTVTQSVA